MRRFFLISSPVMLWLLLSCGDPVSNGAGTGRPVEISGQVLGWWCEVGYPYFQHDLRYTAYTGHPATIKVLNGLAKNYKVSTDSLSAFRIEALSDTFSFEVVTPHTRPDTFHNIAVTGDTSLDLNIVFDFRIADTLEIGFTYMPPSDSFGQPVELSYLRLIRLLSGVSMDVRQFQKIVTDIDGWAWVNRYRVPVDDERPFWRSVDACTEVLNDTSMHIPHQIEVWNEGYICLSAGSTVSDSRSNNAFVRSRVEDQIRKQKTIE